MTAVWPEALPQFVQEQGFDESLPDQTVESQVDAGPSKSRRRFTNAWRPMQWTLQCTAEQAELFEEFYDIACEAGTQPFTWVHPRTQAPATFRFRRPPPKPQPFGAGNVAYRINVFLIDDSAFFASPLDFMLARNTGLAFFMGTY